MTTKSSKATPEAGTQDKLPPREVSEISRLVSRFKWLEADQEYQVENATLPARNPKDWHSSMTLN
jgi:hypothetical protein